MLDRMKEDAVSQDMAFDGLDERRPAALEPLEQVRASEPNQPLPGAGEIFDLLLFLRRAV